MREVCSRKLSHILKQPHMSSSTLQM